MHKHVYEFRVIIGYVVIMLRHHAARLSYTSFRCTSPIPYPISLYHMIRLLREVDAVLK